jgi:hypothetical protein
MGAQRRTEEANTRHRKGGKTDDEVQERRRGYGMRSRPPPNGSCIYTPRFGNGKNYDGGDEVKTPAETVVTPIHYTTMC